MAMRGDEVVESLDKQIKETIDKMVGEIRSSIQDVRDAVDSQLDAALQSVQADVNAITFRPFLLKGIAELEPAEAAAPAQSAPAAPVVGPSHVRRAIQAVERGKNQVDVLNALLEQALGFGSRAALLILKGDTFAGWKGMGFAAYGGNDELIKRFTAAPNTIPEFDSLFREERVIAFNGASFAGRIGAQPPAFALLVPMVIKDKVAAAVYVDVMPGDEAKYDQAAIELLVFSTGLLIDTLAIRKKVPSPSLSSGDTPVEAPKSAPAAAAAPQRATVAPPAPPVAKPAAEVPPPAPPRPAAPPTPQPPPRSAVAAPSFDTETIMPPPARTAPPPSFSAPSLDTDLAPPPPMPRPAAPPPAPPAPVAPAPAPAPEPGEKATTQYIPPPGIQRGGAFGSQSEQGKKHDEARRFARLLVSEIKLYNESKVEQGRKNRDLYERLKEDIDRSRQMYDERIPEDVRKTSNYFYEELVRILADNDSEALGL